jgi:hypothetical protein
MAVRSQDKVSGVIEDCSLYSSSDISDNASIKNDTSCSDESSNRVGQDGRDAQNEIATSESRVVKILRLFVFGIILLSAISISVIVFLISSEGEINEFTGQYDGMVEQLNAAISGIVSERIGSLGTLRVALIAHAIDHNRTWPFVTLSNFPQRAATAKRQSHAVSVGIYPVVQESDRKPWETFFATDGVHWM